MVWEGGIQDRLQLYSTTDMKKSFALGGSAVKKKIAESEKIRKGFPELREYADPGSTTHGTK